MRRRFIALAASLLLCATLNLFVAWGCASWCGAQFADLAVPSGAEGLLAKVMKSSGSDDPSWQGRAAGIGVQWSAMSVRSANVLHVHAGWPAPALEGAAAFAMGAGQEDALHGAIGLSTGTSPAPIPVPLGMPGLPVRRILPLRPVWWGFALDVGLYMAVLWSFPTGFLAIRRWRRRLRHQCTACRYPIGLSDVCTECGQSVAIPARSRACSWTRGALSALVTGLGINVAVAWACAIWSPDGLSNQSLAEVSPEIEWWRSHVLKEVGGDPPTHAVRARLGPAKTSLTMWRSWHEPFALCIRAGWPLPALEADWWELRKYSFRTVPRDRTGVFTSWRTSFLVPDILPGQKSVVAPLGPVMPGFLLNTCLYASAVFLAGCGAVAVRARRRRRGTHAPAEGP